MKKTCRLFITLVLISLLIACDSSDGHETEATFIGTIEEINNQIALISIDEGEILKSGSRVSINLAVNSQETFQVGDKIKVGYDGEVRESGPLGVNETFIEKIN